MSQRIDVLNVHIDNCSAKEAMQEIVSYMDSEPINIIEMVTSGSVMQIDNSFDVKERFSDFDLVLAGEKTLLEAAGVTDGKYLKEAEERTFLKMFLRYLHKHRKQVYLLAETEEGAHRFSDFLAKKYSGIHVAGIAKVSAENRADDMIVNSINGSEVDCVFAALPSPLQEAFVLKNRCLMNARVWLGLGIEIHPTKKPKLGNGLLFQFILKKMLCKEIERRKE